MRRWILPTVAIAGLLGSCGGDDGDADTITLVAYDSFPARDDDSALNDALDAFTDETGIEVETLIAGDAGTMVSKAALTAGNPEGDVMFGVDNTFLSRAVDADVFEPYEADGVERVPDALRQLVPDGEATPIDFGDVCVNYDRRWFADEGLDPPADLEALTDPAYADLLVVENPATSSPGLAFVLASIAAFGEDGWTDYWQRLRDNGVEVVDSWTEAYYERFTHAGGPRPLVVSYGSSPPAELLAANPPVADAPTGVIAATCFRQVEFAGVLAGTDAPDEARRLVDFMLSARFQVELPLTLFVYPADAEVPLPAEFVTAAVVPDDPASIDPATITDEREGWIDTWTEIVIRS